MKKSKVSPVLPVQSSIFSFFSKAAGSENTAPNATPTVKCESNRCESSTPASVASKASTPSHSHPEQQPSVRQDQHQSGQESASLRPPQELARSGDAITAEDGTGSRNLRSRGSMQKQTYMEEEQSPQSESDSDLSCVAELASQPDRPNSQKEKETHSLANKQARVAECVATIQQSLGQFQYEKGKSERAAEPSGRRSGKRALAEVSAGASELKSKRGKSAPKTGAEVYQTSTQGAGLAAADRMRTWKRKEERKAEQAFLDAVENEERNHDEWEAAVSLAQDAVVTGTERDAEANAEAGESVSAGREAGEVQEEGDSLTNSYEKERQARIRQNNAFLLNLGIGALPVHEPSKPKPRMKAKPKRKPSPPPRSHRPRRSTRASGVDVEASAAAQKKQQEADELAVELQEGLDSGTMEESEAAEHAAKIEGLRAEAEAILAEAAGRRQAQRRGGEAEAEAEEEEELAFDDSSVKRYTCQAVTAHTPAADLSDGVGGLAPLEGGTRDAAQMKRIYSLSFHPRGGLVAGAGHGGYAGVFAVEGGGEEEEEAGALLSWKAHGGWVGEVQFLSQQAAGSNLLLTASNDNCVVLWDVNSAARTGKTAVPRRLAEAAFHRGGLFSLHEAGGVVATAGKDGDVVLAEVTGSSLRKSRVFEGVHGNSVVKCVRFRTCGVDGVSNVFASCGNDNQICITDTRVAGSTSCVQEWQAAASCVNFVQWSPVSEHLLISSSFDQDIRLWDVRASGSPMHSFMGHHDVAGVGKVKGMHRACFFAGGRFVAATGDRTDLLSVYDVSSGHHAKLAP